MMIVLGTQLNRRGQAIPTFWFQKDESGKWSQCNLKFDYLAADLRPEDLEKPDSQYTKSIPESEIVDPLANIEGLIQAHLGEEWYEINVLGFPEGGGQKTALLTHKSTCPLWAIEEGLRLVKEYAELDPDGSREYTVDVDLVTKDGNQWGRLMLPTNELRRDELGRPSPKLTEDPGQLLAEALVSVKKVSAILPPAHPALQEIAILQNGLLRVIEKC